MRVWEMSRWCLRRRGRYGSRRPGRRDQLDLISLAAGGAEVTNLRKRKKRMVLSLLSTVLLAAPFAMQDEAGQPKAPAPTIAIATVQQDGRAFIQRAVIRYVPQIRTIEVKSGDKTEKREETVHVPVQEISRVFL